MFATELMTLESLSRCEGDVLKRKQSIEKTILAAQNSRTKENVKMTKLVNALGNYKITELFALTEKSEAINHLCSTNAYLQNRWSNHLKKIGGYPTETFTSFDGTETCNNFETLKGAVLLNTLKKYPKMSKPATHLLNKACDFRLYQALIKRLKSHVSVIKNCTEEVTTMQTLTMHVQSALKDAFKLSNLYWSTGCVDSSMSLLDIIAHLNKVPGYRLDMQRFLHKRKFSWTKYYEADDMPFMLEILKTAVEMLYTSQIIANFSESQNIAAALTNNKGILAGFKSFKTPEELQTKLNTILNRLNIPMPQSFISHAYENALRYVKSHHPNYGMESNKEEHKKRIL